MEGSPIHEGNCEWVHANNQRVSLWKHIHTLLQNGLTYFVCNFIWVFYIFNEIVAMPVMCGPQEDWLITAFISLFYCKIWSFNNQYQINNNIRIHCITDKWYTIWLFLFKVVYKPLTSFNITETTLLFVQHNFNHMKYPPSFIYYTPPCLIKLPFKSQDRNLNIGATSGCQSFCMHAHKYTRNPYGEAKASHFIFTVTDEVVVYMLAGLWHAARA